MKVRKQIERQEEIKKNLEAYYYTLNLFERIIDLNSSLADEESETINVPSEIQELFLKGKNLSEEIVDEATGLVSKDATPVKNSIYSPSYKRRIMGLLLRHTMNEAMRRSER